MRIFKKTKDHITYWKNRHLEPGFDWETSYFDGWVHPHRQMIITYLKSLRHFGTLVELGCASGPNLYLIQKHFPHVKAGGFDISAHAIAVAQKKLKTDTVLDVGDATDIFLSDKSTDVILTDMTLIYLSPLQMHKAMKEIKRVVRSHVIFVEFHSESLWKSLALKSASGYNAYNYKKLLKEHDFFDIQITKIPEELWPGGEPQKTFGYFITAKT